MPRDEILARLTNMTIWSRGSEHAPADLEVV